MKIYVLVDAVTGQAIMPNTPRKTFRGEDVIITSWRAPHKPESTGKVVCRYCNDDAEYTSEWYPSVVGAKFILV